MKKETDKEIKFRPLREAIRLSEDNSDIKYTYISSRIVRLEKKSKIHFIFGYFFDNNPSAAAILTNHKAMMYEVLKEAKVASVPHYALSKLTDPKPIGSNLDELLEKYGDLVIKPNHGYGGDKIARFNDADLAMKFMTDNSGLFWCASPYTEITREIRIVVLNGVAKLTHEKVEPKQIGNLKMYNLKLGAASKSLELSELNHNWIGMAQDAVRAVGMNMAAVDIVLDQQERPYVLEINDSFSLDRFAQSSDEAYTKVVKFYQEALETLF